MNKTLFMPLKQKISIMAIICVFLHNFANASEIALYTGDEEYEIDQNILIINAENSTENTKLQFGQTLNEYLVWDNANSYFTLSNDLNLGGNELLNFNIENLATAPTCDSSSQGRIYFNTADNNTYVCNGTSWETINGGGGTVTASDQPAVQARRTTDYTMSSTSTWYDLELDTTDIETDDTILEHNTSNTDRIDIKESGLYLISYQVNANNSSTHQLETRVRANDSTVLNGSYLVNRNYGNEYGPTTAVFLAELSTNDYITLQVMRTTSNEIINETTLTITQMKQGVSSGSSSGSEITRIMAQFYDSTGGTDVNTDTATTIPWNQESLKDSGITHNTSTNNSRIYLDEAGVYTISYSISHESQTSGRKNVHCWARLNGTTKVTPSDSYSYSRNTTDEFATNTANFIIETSSDDEYYEILCMREGSAYSSDMIANQSWVITEKKP